MKISALLCLSFCVLLLTSCAKEEEKKKSTQRSSVGQIYFDQSVNEKEAGALVASLEHLAENRLLNAEPRLLEIMGAQAGDGATVKSWLEERVQVVVGESFDIDRGHFALASNFPFENAGVIPTAWKNRRRATNEERNAKLVMANIGALYYLLGKETNTLRAANTSTPLGRLEFKSPRTGLIAIGEGLLGVVPAGHPLVERAFQLSTLLHEAHHSDGNGLSAGFVHAQCPAGHSLEGVNACDEAGNGPYMVDALAMKSMRLTCAGCSTAERKYMEAEEGDSYGRVISPGLTWDAHPEGRR